MASSSSSAVRELLVAYLAGRVKADRVAAAVAEAYYRERGRARELLRPAVDVIERAAPGVVDLVRTQGGAGFDIRLAERPFPAQYESQLRTAAQAVLEGSGAAAEASAAGREVGVVRRLLRAVRRIFSASDG